MPEVPVSNCPQFGNGREGGGCVGSGGTMIPGGPGFLFSGVRLEIDVFIAYKLT